jgi:hypothetical protein
MAELIVQQVAAQIEMQKGNPMWIAFFVCVVWCVLSLS